VKFPVAYDVVGEIAKFYGLHYIQQAYGTVNRNISAPFPYTNHEPESLSLRTEIMFWH